MFSILMVNRAQFECQLMAMEIFFSAEIGDERHHVETGETGSTNEQPENILQMPTAEHQGRVCSSIIY